MPCTANALHWHDTSSCCAARHWVEVVGPTRDQRGLGVRCNNNWSFAREAPRYSQSAQAAIIPSERGTSPPGARRAAPPPPAADLLDEFFGNVNTCVGQLFSLVSRMLVPLAGRASQSRTCGRTSGSVPRRSHGQCKEAPPSLRWRQGSLLTTRSSCASKGFKRPRSRCTSEPHRGLPLRVWVCI